MGYIVADMLTVVASVNPSWYVKLGCNKVDSVLSAATPRLCDSDP